MCSYDSFAFIIGGSSMPVTHYKLLLLNKATVIQSSSLVEESSHMFSKVTLPCVAKRLIATVLYQSPYYSKGKRCNFVWMNNVHYKNIALIYDQA